jgi:hypothetical protein
VTHDPRYYNASLADPPYGRWNDVARGFRTWESDTPDRHNGAAPSFTPTPQVLRWAMPCHSGVGVAADTVALTLLAMSLCAVFGGNLSETTAKALAIAAVKNSMVNQPIKLLSRELSRFVPLLGQLVAPALSLAMLEAAGWALARELEDRARGKAD